IVAPPAYPAVVLITPGTLSKSDCTHQKQPPANVAFAARGAGASAAAGNAAASAMTATLFLAMPRNPLISWPHVGRPSCRNDRFRPPSTVTTVAPLIPTLAARSRYPAPLKASPQGRRSGDRARWLRANPAFVSMPLAYSRHGARSWQAPRFSFSPCACAAVLGAAAPRGQSPLRPDAATTPLHALSCVRPGRRPKRVRTAGSAAKYRRLPR